MATWSPGISLRGLTGPASIVTVTAPPGPNVGVVDGYAVWNNNGIVLLYGPKTSNGWPQVGGVPGSSNPASVQLTGQQGVAGTAGADGATIVPVTGQPDGTVGKNGDYALDFGNAFLYGPKAAGTWPTQPISIVGPRGSDATLGVDFTGNSLSLSPLNNAALPSAIKQTAANGSILFASDTAGNVQAAGTLKVTGATTLAAATCTSIANSGNESVGGTLTVSGPSSLAAVTATGTAALAGATCTTLAASGNTSVGGTLAVTGAASTAAITATGLVTAPNVTLTSGGGGKLTFADGTSQTTASTGTSTSASASRTVIDLGGYYALNTDTTFWTTAWAQLNDKSVGTSPMNLPVIWRAPFAGSITGWTLLQYVNNGTQQFQITKNRTGASLNAIVTNNNAGNATVNGFPGNTFGGTYVKGTYSFNAGDTIGVVVAYGTGTSTNTRFHITVEWT